ncbi:MAG TPA: RNA polymerase sigma factor [Acidobacteriota bacterium]|nr:RNA polymerase sigma factor [Acidobacteriota bacterium]
MRENRTASDSEGLAAAVHQNVEGAIERLVQHYEDALFAYALRLLRDRFEAQEVTQDAFIRAIRALTSRYDEDKCRVLELKPWLFRITRNLAYSKRKLRRYSAEVPLPENGDGSVQSACSHPVAAASLEAREQRDLMERALTRLRPEARDLVLLRFMEELSYAEIATVMNASESSVRGKVFRALQALRKALERQGNHDAM